MSHAPSSDALHKCAPPAADTHDCKDASLVAKSVTGMFKFSSFAKKSTLTCSRQRHPAKVRVQHMPHARQLTWVPLLYGP